MRFTVRGVRERLRLRHIPPFRAYDPIVLRLERAYRRGGSLFDTVIVVYLIFLVVAAVVQGEEWNYGRFVRFGEEVLLVVTLTD